MGGLQRSPHHMHISGAIKCVVASTIRHLNQPLLDCLALLQFRRVDKVSRAKLLAPLLLFIVHIHHDDLGRFILDAPLNHAESNTARAEDRNVASLLDTVLAGRDDGSAVTRCDTTPEQTATVHRGLLRDRHNRYVRYDRVLRESRGAHEV